MAAPAFNVQQFDYGKSRAQLTYLNAHVAVACAHFIGTYTVDDLVFLRMTPPPGALELSITNDLPEIGTAMTVLWCDRGFQCIKEARVSRVQPQDHSFALFLGWSAPEDVAGISGALCWDGVNATGIATGVQRDSKTAHLWVQQIDPEFANRVSNTLSVA